MLSQRGGNLNVRRRRRLHSFGGHLARMEDGLAHDALRVRSLGWWRHFQKTGSLKHPRRFHVWRWESQLAEFYGEASAYLSTRTWAGWLQRNPEMIGEVKKIILHTRRKSMSSRLYD